VTCIVGLVRDGRVYIGGDSAGVDTSGSYDLTVRADQKVFKKGPFLFGFTTSFRMGQLLRYASIIPDRIEENQDVMKYMVTDFIDSLRDCFKKYGFAVKKDEQESAGTFLVGYQGRLFAVYNDYQVAEASCGYEAVGSGFSMAKGALHVLAEFSHAAPEFIVHRALAAAEAHNAAVRGPYHVEVL
jgi:ATP-dependent protease HslVU (ClpYQ) peptidase subunit